VAIRQMLRVPHPRDRKKLWLRIAVGAVVAILVQLVRPGSWPTFAIGAGAVLGVAAVFTLLGRLWGWIAIAVALGIGLGFVPLFGVLGLELALVAAVFGAIMGADVGSSLARTLARAPAEGVTRSAFAGRTLGKSAVSAALLAVAVAAIPAVIAALRGIVVPTCDWRFGIESYIAMPIVTAAFAGAIGHAMGALAGPRRYLGPILAQLPAVVVALAAVWRFHEAPPVYTYNAILGYFPGNMYDENVSLGSPLLWSRIEQLFWVIGVIALVARRFDVPTYRVRLRMPRPAGRRLGALGLVFLSFACAIAMRCNGGAFGYAVDADDMEEALGKKLETEHFIIYYSPSKEVEADLSVIAEDHEFRYDQVVKQLGVAPEGKLTSFYFADRDQKARLHGSRDVEMAKPWRQEIYIDHRAFPHSSLRHEIAHAVASEFGDPLWGVAAKRVLGLPLLVSPGLVEGLAVAIDWPAGYDRLNPHESVRVIQKLDKLPSLDTLFGLSFFSVSSAQGYTTAGSFLKFLLDRYGAAKLRVLYASGGDFEEAYGVPRSRLEGEWREMLATIELPDSTVKASQERFRGTSVFARPCAHAIAKRRDRAFEVFGEGDRDGAINLMRQLCTEAPEEPNYRLALGDFLYSGNEVDRAEAQTTWLLVAADAASVTSSLRARGYERLARAAGTRGDFDSAGKLVELARALPLEPEARRTLDGMAFALTYQGPAATALRNYFFPPKGTTVYALEQATLAVTADPELGLAHYLLGFQRNAASNWAGAASEFEQALAHALPTLAFTRNAARLLAVAAYRTGDKAKLAVATATLSGPTMTSGDHLLAQDWQDRLAFDAKRAATSR
jgi:tetratricopeptide (TPR) repeat protein